MDYSNRVNSKQGSGGVADTQETNVHTRRRIKELLNNQVLDIDNDPYVFKNHLGILECKLCLTTHNNEASYISHIGGKKHQLSLEKRRRLDAKYNGRNAGAGSDHSNVVSISNVPKRTWNKIGTPAFKVTKIRDPDSLSLGLLINVKCPKLRVDEPQFRIMSYYEIKPENRSKVVAYLNTQVQNDDPTLYQYIVITAEPYENICIAIPNKEILRPKANDEMSDTYWWYWDSDTMEFFLQLLFVAE